MPKKVVETLDPYLVSCQLSPDIRSNWLSTPLTKTQYRPILKKTNYHVISRDCITYNVALFAHLASQITANFLEAYTICCKTLVGNKEFWFFTVLSLYIDMAECQQNNKLNKFQWQSGTSKEVHICASV